MEQWVSTSEVAQHIGKPESWVYANARRLGMPRSRVGQHYRWKLSLVDAWMEGLGGIA